MLTAQTQPITDQPQAPPRIAYVMSRFPKITETFVLYEMMAVERCGLEVELYPLIRERSAVMHQEAERWVARARFTPWLSPSMLRSHGHYLLRRPFTYFAILWTLLVQNLGSRRFLAGAIAFFPKAVHIAWLMQRQGISHIHAHFASHPAAVAYVVSRLSDIPFSFTAHGSDLHRDQHMLGVKVRQAAFVAAISDYNRKMLIEHAGQETAHKVKIVHCGVDTDRFAGDTTQWDESQRNLHTAAMICIGTMHEVKGQRYLIEACRLLSQRGVGFHLHLVGDGPDLEERKAQAAEAGLGEQITFHGRRTRDEIIDLLRKMDVAIAPSVPTSDGRREGIPVVLMEAMAMQVPVVSSRLSGIPELVIHRETGLLTEPGDITALAAAIEDLIANPRLRRRLAQAGRDKVLHEFDQEENARALSSLFASPPRNVTCKKHEPARQNLAEALS